MLKSCIDEHPILSTVIVNGDTESPEIATPKVLDLHDHLEVREAYEDVPEARCIETLLAQVGDERFSHLHIAPPWKVVLVPLASDQVSAQSKLLVLYSNYHSHGDGRSGLAFQNSFHRAHLKCATPANDDRGTTEPIYKASTKPLLPPIEEGGKLTLSWPYLLSPLLGTYLPTSVTSFLGIRTSWLSHETGIWRGEKTAFDPANHSTGLVLLTVQSVTMSRVLQHCRVKSTTFTGLLEHLIVRSLVASDGGAITMGAFNTGIAIDMRHLFGDRYAGGSMLNCVTGYSEMVVLDRSQEEDDWATNPSSKFWEAARKTSADLKAAASTLHNQPIGLLQYLKNFRPWTTGQIGKDRETSFEISNLGAFSPSSDDEDNRACVSIEKVIFSQPAKATGSLLDFNAVSVKGGPLVMTVTWQLGVLGLPTGMEEKALVKNVCSKLESLICEIADMPL